MLKAENPRHRENPWRATRPCRHSQSLSAAPRRLDRALSAQLNRERSGTIRTTGAITKSRTDVHAKVPPHMNRVSSRLTTPFEQIIFGKSDCSPWWLMSQR